MTRLHACIVLVVMSKPSLQLIQSLKTLSSLERLYYIVYLLFSKVVCMFIIEHYYKRCDRLNLILSNKLSTCCFHTFIVIIFWKIPSSKCERLVGLNRTTTVQALDTSKHKIGRTTNRSHYDYGKICFRSEFKYLEA